MEEILLLHGAIGAKDQLEKLADELSAEYIVHSINLSGHGGFQADEPFFSIEVFASDVLAYLDKKNIDTISVFGYSMGGYVALYVAKHHTHKIKKIITLGTKFNWNETIAANEVKMLQPEKIQEKLPVFANSLIKRHGQNHWKKVLEKTAAMLIAMGNQNPLLLADYKNIQHQVLVLLGENDKMVSVDETHKVCDVLPNASFLSLPDTPHPIEAVDTANLAQIITRFIT